MIDQSKTAHIKIDEERARIIRDAEARALARKNQKESKQDISSGQYGQLKQNGFKELVEASEDYCTAVISNNKTKITKAAAKVQEITNALSRQEVDRLTAAGFKEVKDTENTNHKAERTRNKRHRHTDGSKSSSHIRHKRQKLSENQIRRHNHRILKKSGAPKRGRRWDASISRSSSSSHSHSWHSHRRYAPYQGTASQSSLSSDSLSNSNASLQEVHTHKGRHSKGHASKPVRRPNRKRHRSGFLTESVIKKAPGQSGEMRL